MAGMSVRRCIRRGVVVAALPVLAAGCATQEWTRDLFAKRLAEVDEHVTRIDAGAREQGRRIDHTDARLDRVEDHLDRLDERLVRVDTDARAHDARIDRVETQVTQLDTGLTETRRLVRGMIAQAPSTGIRGNAVEPRTARSSPDAGLGRSLVGIIHVRFAFGRADLDAGAQAALTAIAKELRDNPQLTLDLEGATDPVGSLEYNVRLSQQRVETVQRWLERNGVSRTRIVGSVGRGPLVDASVSDDAKRRVMVKLMTSK